MGFVAEDLSTTYHERYKWCSAYLKGLPDLQTNPERYINLGVWEAQFDSMVNEGARDERAKKAKPRRDRYAGKASRSLAHNPGYKWLRSSGKASPGKPLSDTLHCVIVHNIVTHLLSYVDRMDFASLAYANKKENTK